MFGTALLLVKVIITINNEEIKVSGTDFRMTHQRRLILDELKKLKTHPTADEIYVIVRKKMPRISLGTVYRNLEILSETGQIIKIEGFR